jgi:aerobic-type carbon monoxide dehydrogenase small subunit (CoxS/CutS family)
MRLLHERHGDDERGPDRPESQASLEEVKEALVGNLCRCGTHDRVLAAAMRATGRART